MAAPKAKTESAKSRPATKAKAKAKAKTEIAVAVAAASAPARANAKGDNVVSTGINMEVTIEMLAKHMQHKAAAALAPDWERAKKLKAQATQARDDAEAEFNRLLMETTPPADDVFDQIAAVCRAAGLPVQVTHEKPTDVDRRGRTYQTGRMLKYDSQGSDTSDYTTRQAQSTRVVVARRSRAAFTQALVAAAAACDAANKTLAHWTQVATEILTKITAIKNDQSSILGELYDVTLNRTLEGAAIRAAMESKTALIVRESRHPALAKAPSLASLSALPAPAKAQADESADDGRYADEDEDFDAEFEVD